MLMFNVLFQIETRNNTLAVQVT